MNRPRPTRRGVATAVLATALFAGGLAAGNPGMKALGGVAAAAVLVGLLPSLTRVRPVVTRTVSSSHVERGGRAVATLIIRNDGPARQPGFVAFERIDGHAVDIAVPALPAGELFRHTYAVPTGRRGRVMLGPITIARADPLGMGRTTADTDQVDQVWVTPRRRPARTAGGGRLLHHHEGDPADLPLRGSTDIRHLRDYVPGDELRHIHWRASARAGHLVVRDYVDPVRPHATVVLDNRSTALDPDAFEEAVETAASLLWSSVLAGARVTLRTADGAVVDGGDRPESAQPVLDRLAAVEQVGTTDLLPALDAVSRATRGGWLVLCGGAGEPGVSARLAGLRASGPVNVFDHSGWPEGAAVPGVVTVRAATAAEAVSRWNGMV